MVLPNLYGNIIAGNLYGTLHDALGVLASMGRNGANGGGSPSGNSSPSTTTVSKGTTGLTTTLKAIAEKTTEFITSTTTTTTQQPTTTTPLPTTSTTQPPVTQPAMTTIWQTPGSQPPTSTTQSPYGPLSEEAVIGLAVAAAVLFVAGFIALLVWLIYRGIKKSKVSPSIEDSDTEDGNVVDDSPPQRLTF